MNPNTARSAFITAAGHHLGVMTVLAILAGCASDQPMATGPSVAAMATPGDMVRVVPEKLQPSQPSSKSPGPHPTKIFVSSETTIIRKKDVKVTQVGPNKVVIKILTPKTFDPKADVGPEP